MAFPDLKFRLSANDREARAALSRARTEVRGLGRDARTASADTRRFSTAARDTGNSSRRFGSQVQNAAFQVGDFAVQVGGGTSAMRAMSQQLPQLLGGFGVMGAVAGAAVAVIGPLTQSLFDGGKAAREASDAMSGLSGSMTDLKSLVGQQSALQERLNLLHRAQGDASASGASAVIANSQKEYEARQELIKAEQVLLRLRSQDAQQALKNLQSQARAQINRAFEDLATDQDLQGGIFNPGAPLPQQGPATLAQLIPGQRARRAFQENQRTMAELKVDLSQVEVAAQQAGLALNGAFGVGGGVVGSGGGLNGGERETPVQTAIQKHMDSIQELTRITKSSLGEASGAWGNYFDDVVSRSGSSSQRLLAISKSFGAAQALIDAWQAHNAVLKDPTLPWWLRIASAGKVLASGLGAVNAIKGVTAGGGSTAAGGGSAGAAAAASAPQGPLEATLNLQGPLAQIIGGEIGGLLDRLNEEAGDRGYRLLVAGN